MGRSAAPAVCGRTEMWRINDDMPKVTIRNEPPPIYARALETFGLTTSDVVNHHIIFSYDHVIWNPSGQLIQDHAIIHEQVHFGQQDAHPDGCDEWWNQYLTDELFRFQEEIKAYRAQYKWAVKNWKDRELRAKLLHYIALDLSGKMYGTMCTYQEAHKLICQK